MKRPVVLAAMAAIAALLIAAALATVALLPERGQAGTPRRSGPPALVGSPSLAPMVWLLTKREERFGRRDTRQHFDLHAIDPKTAERRWMRRLLTVHEGGHGATGRILGMERDTVWLFLHNQPVALAAGDGSVKATGITLAETNPGLAPMWPTTPRSFIFDGSLVVTTADALHWRIEPGSWRASGYQPENGELFRRAQFMSTDWNGGYRTHEFLTRQQTTHEGQWIGLYSEREAADAVEDGFGSHHKNPDGVHDEGALARRSFRVATIGKTRKFSEGAHDRLRTLTPTGDGAVYLQGGLLRASGVRVAFRPDADSSAIVVHRTRTDDAGLLVLTRVQPDLRQRWNLPLPIGELRSRWELPGHLVLVGNAVTKEEGRSEHKEFVLAVDLAAGKLRRWSIEHERTEP